MGKDRAPAVKAARCACEGRCSCGVRPERPSHGHVWDVAKQGWVGRGAKETRVAAKLTDKGPITAKDGIKVESWQRLPSTLIGEWCQREKRPRPDYRTARPAKGAQGDFKCRYRCILPDKKKPGSEHDLTFCPTAAFATEPSARESAALLALFHVMPLLPLELKLPEPYRASWLSVTGRDKPKNKFEAKAADRKAAALKPTAAAGLDTGARADFLKRVNDGADVGQAAASVAPKAPLQTAPLAMDAKYASRAEADRARREREAVSNGKQHKREARARANRDAKVFMADRVRRDICALLGLDAPPPIEASDADAGDTIADLEDPEARAAAAHVVSLGFEPARVLAALKHAAGARGDGARNQTDDLLRWLCLHTPEDELPPSFDPRGANLDVIAPKAPTRAPPPPSAETVTAAEAAAAETVAAETAAAGDVADCAAAWPMSAAAAEAWAQWRLGLNARDMPTRPAALASDVREEVEALEATVPCAATEIDGFGFSIRVGAAILLAPAGYPETLPAACIFVGAAVTANDGLTQLALERFSELAPALYDLAELAADVAAAPAAPGRAARPAARTSKATPRATPPPAPGANTKAAVKRPRRGTSWWDKPSDPSSSRAPGPSTLVRRQREALPAAKAAAAVVEALAGHQVLLIEGGTGCGKTTQVPQFILEDARAKGVPCKVVVAQPRRIAAVGVASRVADERGESVGDTVGVMVRGESKSCDRTSLLFCTTGVLLQRLRSDPMLDHVTHVVVDEVHERHLDADVLLALLRFSLERPALRVVLMSATMDTERFAAYFADLPNCAGKPYGGKCPCIAIPGFAYPVDVFYLDDVYSKLLPDSRQQAADAEEDDYGDGDAPKHHRKKQDDLFPGQLPRVDFVLVAKCVLALAEKEVAVGGAVLVFCPGAYEISRICSDLEKHDLLRPVPLHGGLSARDQQKAFEKAPQGFVKVVVATNVAETSITIADVTAVVDLCRAKETGFDAARGVPCLTEQWIARDAAKQRAGRAGRVRRGECWRFVRKSFFDKLAEHTTPEVHRVSLEGLVMQILAMARPVAPFAASLLDAPRPEALTAAIEALEQLAAVRGGVLTPLGRHLSCLPCAARLGKLLVLGSALGASTREAALSVAAGLSVRSPWRGGREMQERVDATKRALRDAAQCGRSDHALLAQCFDEFSRERGQSKQRRFCADRGLAFEPLAEMASLRGQFSDALVDRGFSDLAEAQPLEGAGLWRVMRALVAAALYPNLIRVDKPTQRYAETAGGVVATDAEASQLRFMRRGKGGQLERVFLHPSSVNFGERAWPSPWAVYHECVATTKTFVRDCSEASPYALLLLCGALEARPLDGTIVVDGWASFAAGGRVAALVSALREALDALLEAKADDPAVRTATAPVTAAITRLLLHDGLN
ncbi:hypothetical protein M885DRAFT_474356 [Pelagophyceae sp. CCMP2097]|nr:hypothetical protein M885DRAFT_474356 [Pelagophyceae sp. CCMP2097]